MIRIFLKYSLLICILMLGSIDGKSQVEVLRISVKDFKAFGFGGFLNFSFPIAEETNYLTIEGGYQYLKDEYDDVVGYIPVLLGYRYTLDRSGSGLFVEPFGGYSFGDANLYKYTDEGYPVYDDAGNQVKEKVAGPTAGLGFGYLFPSEDNRKYNLALRYSRTISEAHTNTFSLRFSYNFF